MTRILLFIRTHTYIILLYIVSVVIISFLFPREGKFPYEFQRGKVWGHEDLFAPFDVPILKSQQELEAEKDSLRNSFILYYNYHPDIKTAQQDRFEQIFEEHWNDDEINKNRKAFLSDLGFFLLDSIYTRGVIDETNEPGLKTQSDQIMVIRNNIGEENDINDLFTQKLAYEVMISRISQLEDKKEADFLKSLNLNDFILPNVLFNADVTNNVRTEQINRISPTKGVVPLNRKIIARGEIVNDEKYDQLLSLKYEFENKVGSSSNFKQILLGQVIIITLCFMLIYLYLMYFRKEIFRNTLKTGFILLLMVIYVGIACFVVRHEYFNLYALPSVLVPVILCTFYDARTATFAYMVSILMTGFIAPNSFEFVFLNFIAGIIGIVNAKSLYRRGTLFRSVLWIILSYFVVYSALLLVQGISISQVDWMNYVRFVISGALLFIAYPCIYIFEKIFGFLSDITLMELSDTNQPLLRQLGEVAPGTFQHSLQVANLSEEVIQKIGGNPLLVRTAALYHDIGKITRPAYFIETQAGSRNPHEDLSPESSAQIIIEHVSKGIDIAKKHHIPQQVIDFIRTHHGTTTVRFFYHLYQKLNQDKKVDRTKFTYPGPIPFSKEMVVLMMCDSIEAASRSLKEINHKTISDLVDNIVNYQILEDQYNDANITYREINTAKQVIKNRLMNIYHVRIEYPK